MILSIVIIIAVIAADMATKYFAACNLAPDGVVTVIPGVVEFRYVENEGAAFGMLADHRWVFLVFSSMAIIAILVYLFVKRPLSRFMRVSLAMIAGGGIGNMIERIFRGYVTDFINPTFFDFYVFNVADSCVTVGCALLILWMIADTVKESKKKKLADGERNSGGDGDGAAPSENAPREDEENAAYTGCEDAAPTENAPNLSDDTANENDEQ